MFMAAYVLRMYVSTLFSQFIEEGVVFPNSKVYDVCLSSSFAMFLNLDILHFSPFFAISTWTE